jgi:hypothetical protein
MTDELIEKLKKYVDSKYYLVEHDGYKIYDISLRVPEEGDMGWPAFYLNGDMDSPNSFEDTSPKDFVVYQLVRIEW